MSALWLRLCSTFPSRAANHPQHHRSSRTCLSTALLPATRTQVWQLLPPLWSWAGVPQVRSMSVSSNKGHRTQWMTTYILVGKAFPIGNKAGGFLAPFCSLRRNCSTGNCFHWTPPRNTFQRWHGIAGSMCLLNSRVYVSSLILQHQNRAPLVSMEACYHLFFPFSPLKLWEMIFLLWRCKSL